MTAPGALAGLLALALLPAAARASGGSASLSVSATVVRGAARQATPAERPASAQQASAAALPPLGSLRLTASGATRATPPEPPPGEAAPAGQASPGAPAR